LEWLCCSVLKTRAFPFKDLWLRRWSHDIINKLQIFKFYKLQLLTCRNFNSEVSKLSLPKVSRSWNIYFFDVVDILVVD
jgi:hypothetical protein